MKTFTLYIENFNDFVASTVFVILANIALILRLGSPRQEREGMGR